MLASSTLMIETSFTACSYSPLHLDRLHPCRWWYETSPWAQQTRCRPEASTSMIAGGVESLRTLNNIGTAYRVLHRLPPRQNLQKCIGRDTVDVSNYIRWRMPVEESNSTHTTERVWFEQIRSHLRHARRRQLAVCRWYVLSTNTIGLSSCTEIIAPADHRRMDRNRFFWWIESDSAGSVRGCILFTRLATMSGA